MAEMTNTITREIEAVAATLPEGQTLSAKGLLHLGSREAVDQALSRLVKRQKLLRAGRGVYVRPVSGKFGTRPPSAVKVVEALAAETGETISQTGAAAANALGLTTQVPVKEVFYTSGRTRTLKLGKQTIELQHMPAWQTVLPASKAGQVVRALAWLGKGEVEAPSLFWNVRLTPREVEELKGVTRTLPTWLARRIGQFVTHV